MAIFGSNRCAALEGSVIEADMSYAGLEGAGRALREAKENDLIMFTGVMTNDIKSILTEEWEERCAITEASVKGIWTSVVTIFEKLVAKIKGIIATATSKFTAFINDGEKLTKQYSKVLSGKDLSGCTLKIREFDKDAYEAMSVVQASDWNINDLSTTTATTPEDGAVEMMKKLFPAAYVSAKTGDGGSADKAFDTCFKAEAEVTVSVDGWVSDCLKKTFLNDIIKANRASEAAANNIVKSAKKKEAETLKNMKKSNMNDKESKDAKDKSEETAANLVAIASKFQTEVISFTTARLNCAKKASIQARKMFMAAVSYKAKKEDKKQAETSAVNAGFEFVSPSINHAGLYNVLGESSYIDVANVEEFEAECFFN